MRVVQAAAQQWPDCKVTWIVHERFAAIVRASPFVHQVVTFPETNRIRAMLRIFLFLRKNPFDLIWDMHGLLRAALCTLFARSPHKWGVFLRKKGLGGFPYTQRFSFLNVDDFRHVITCYQQFLAHAGLDVAVTAPLQLKPTAFFGDEKINAFLTAKGDGRLFVIFTDSSRKVKNWSGFAELSQLILEKIPRSRIVWCGMKTTPSPSDAPEESFLNLQGKTSLEQMITVVRQPSVFIGNDSGPMHLAAAVGNPVLALFGPTSPKSFGPWPVDVPTSEVVMAPNGEMSALKVETVFAALQTLLARVT